jgi:hypothetical protein
MNFSNIKAIKVFGSQVSFDIEGKHSNVTASKRYSLLLLSTILIFYMHPKHEEQSHNHAVYGSTYYKSLAPVALASETFLALNFKISIQNKIFPK